MTAVIVGSLLPGPVKENLGAVQIRAQVADDLKIRHRLIHLLAFGSSYFLLSLLAWNRREELETAGEVLAVGCLVELAQDVMYSHGEFFEWWDVRDDAIGIAVAFLAIQLMRRITPPLGSDRDATA